MSNKRVNKRKARREDTIIVNCAELSGDGQKIVQAITVQLDMLREEFRLKMAEKDKQIMKLNEVVSTLKCDVMKLEERLKDAYAYERKDTLIFSGEGIPESSIVENCTTTVRDIVRNKLKINMGESDVSTAHRLGKKPNNQQPNRRSTIIKLCRRDQKSYILNACRQLKPNIFVNESLTPIRGTIMCVLRKAKRQFPRIFTGCHSRDGRVFVWFRRLNSSGSDKDTHQPINSKHRLEEFCSEVVRVPLDSLIENWPH